jgi:hypothetical protein
VKILSVEIVNCPSGKEDAISIGPCYTIISDDLGMHRASSQFVPSLLTRDNKLHGFSICENLLQR